mgnify:CR=1 FL=1|tara:strand:+ start:1407 stop:5039 length:3633 start_codon:yes stop_codon:yes gene_type:complete
MKHFLFLAFLILSFNVNAQFYPVANDSPYCDAGGGTYLNNDCIQEVSFVDIDYQLDATSVEVYTDFTMTQQTFDEFDQGLAFTTATDNPNWNFFWAPPFSFYQYFTEVEKGMAYPIDVYAAQMGGSTWNTPDRYVKVFIDWNQDGDFNDVDEDVLTAGPDDDNNDLYFSGLINVPVTALNGPTVMRVILSRTNSSASFGPCSIVAKGEAEDYTVIVGGLISDINSIDVSCNGQTDGEITIDAPAAITPYSISIDGGLTFPYTGIADPSFTISGLSAGSYNIVVEDSQPETDVYSANPVVINEPDLVSFSAGVSSNYNGAQISCIGESDGEIQIFAQGGLGPYLYEYTLGAGPMMTSNDNLVTGLSAGLYEINVHDDNGCISTPINVLITEPGELINTATITSNISCDGASDGEMIINVVGGTPGYDVLIDGVSNGDALVTNLSEGTYTIQVIDANNCASIEETIDLTDPEPVTVSASISTDFNGYSISCNGLSDGEISITTAGGTTPYTYSINGGVSFDYTSSIISNLQAGSFDVATIDANGCVSTIENITLTEPTQLEITAVDNLVDVSCFGFSDAEVEMVSSGGVPTYNYSITGGAPFPNTSTVTNLSQGTYFAVVQDLNLCESEPFEFLITEPDPLTFNAFIASNYYGEDVSCNGVSDGIIEVVPSGGTYPYYYSLNGGANIMLPSPSNLITLLAAGSYDVSVSDANNCPSATVDISLLLTEPDVVNINSFVSSDYNGQEISCFGANDGVITITASGGTQPYEYSANAGVSFVTSGQPNTCVVSNLFAGAHTTLVQDANGCFSNLEIVNITQTPELTVTVLPTNVGCGSGSDGSADLDIVGGTPTYDYLWSNGQTVLPAIGFAAGTYNVTVTDVNGCTNTQQFDITEPALTIDGTDILCYGDANGMLTVTIINPNIAANYGYLWTDAAAQTTATATGLNSGVYQVTVSDQFGCELTATDSVIQPVELEAFLDYTYICENDLSSDIICYPSGGVLPYTYLWSDLSTTTGIYDIIEGNYTVVVTDYNGCQETQSIEILPLNPIVVQSQVTPPSCKDNTDGAIITSISGGYPPYIFDWSNGVVDEDNIGVSAGDYSLEVIDQGGCNTIYPVTVVADSEECLETFSGFTPNGDQNNDYWYIEGIELYPDALVEVYNRWGDRVFAAKRYNNSWQEAWNGMYNGEPLPPATYYYVINLNNGDPLLKGTVTLIR